MTKRIDFSIVKISGEDENNPASELNIHQPTVKGWQSPRFCPYPQVIVVQLEARSRICKLQFLSHHYLISRNIEINVGDVPKGLLEVPQNATWEKIGEVKFSDNSSTNRQAREMKSAYLDVVAKFIKLVIHQNHVNRSNLCNQVGLVAINVIGEIVFEGGSKKDKYLTEEDILKWRAQNISPMEDLSFCLYVDSEIAQLLRVLYAKKQKAVSGDRFVYAKKLKYAITELRRVGEKIGKYDIQKQEAIEKEDYDKAHLKKEQIEEFRLKEYERLHIPELMEMDGYNPDEDYQQKSKVKKIFTPPLRKSPPEKAFAPILGNYVSHDDSALPAPKKNGKSQPSVFGVEDMTGESDLKLGKMTEKERHEASFPIEVFGLSLVEKMYSKSYAQREEALKEVKIFMEKYQRKGKSHSSADVVKATTFLIQRALKDQVHSVYVSALEVLKYCFKYFAPSQRVPKMEVSLLSEKSTPDIINKLGDTAPRIRKISMDYMIEIAAYPEVEDIQTIPTYCLEPVTNNLNVRLAQAKLELVENIVKKYPNWKYNILTLNKVMPFLVNSLQHPSASVRRIAECTIIYLYQHQGELVRPFLPSDVQVSKRNIMYKRIFEQLDKLDRQLGTDKKRTERKNHQSSKPKCKPEMFNNEHEDIDIEKTCIFCNEKNKNFTPKVLDIHYSKDCPMLCHCSNCNQVVEIAGLTEHLLDECEFQMHFQRCPICLEAVSIQNFEEHIKRRNCVMANSAADANHCPLCHDNIEPGEVGWKKHLMEESGCPSNLRCKGAQRINKKGTLGRRRKKVATMKKAGRNKRAEF